MAKLGLTITIGLDKESLKKANRKIGDFLTSGLKAGALGAAGALATVGAAAGAAAVETLAFADEANAAMEDFRRTTGLSEEGVEAFSQSAKNLFALGVGEGIEDIAASMAEVNNLMQTGAEETENITRKALVMRDVFDKDVGESVDSVKVLMDDFGLTSEQAFDFLTEGIQKGLDRNGDLLESVSEYGNLFSDAGFSANEFFSIMESGAEGGVLGTDKIADAVKELGIRLNEGGKDAKEAFSDVVGASFDEVEAQIRAGEASWADYFDDIIQGLQDIEDPLERNRIQVALFGSQAEDLGAGFAEDIDISATSLQEMAGAMDTVVEKNTNIGESMENLRRQMVVALEPAAQELLPLLADGVTKVSEFLMEARPIFTGFAQDLSQTLGPALQIIGDSLVRIGAVFGIVSEDASGLDAALKILEGTLDLVVTGIEAVAIVSSLLADAFERARDLGSQLGQIFSLIGDAKEAGGTSTGLGSLLGFQEGGSFTVGGSGGPDSQLVAFRATPGEDVRITPPGGGGGGITININAPVFGVDDLDRKLNDWGQMVVDNVAGALN